jgi:hypothetical protein
VRHAPSYDFSKLPLINGRFAYDAAAPYNLLLGGKLVCSNVLQVKEHQMRREVRKRQYSQRPPGSFTNQHAQSGAHASLGRNRKTQRVSYGRC